MKKFLYWLHILPVIKDTLMRDGKWSMTKIFMAMAFNSALYSFFFDLNKNGFNYETFATMLGVGLGAKVTDAWSKKITPPANTNLPPS